MKGTGPGPRVVAASETGGGAVEDENAQEDRGVGGVAAVAVEDTDADAARQSRGPGGETVLEARYGGMFSVYTNVRKGSFHNYDEPCLRRPPATTSATAPPPTPQEARGHPHTRTHARAHTHTQIRTRAHAGMYAVRIGLNVWDGGAYCVCAAGVGLGATRSWQKRSLTPKP